MVGSSVGKLRKPLGKTWASLPIEGSGNRRACCRLTGLRGCGRRQSTHCSDCSLSRFLGNVCSDRRGKKICSYGNLISSLSKLSPQGKIISEIPRNLYKFNGVSWTQVLKQSTIYLSQVSEDSIPFLDSVTYSLNKHQLRPYTASWV